MSLNLWNRSNRNTRWNGDGIWTLSVALLGTLFTILMVLYINLLTGCDPAPECCSAPGVCGNFDMSQCEKPENNSKVYVPVPTTKCPICPKCEECIEPGAPPTCNNTETCVTPFGKCVADCVKTHGANKYGACVKACRKEQA